MVYIIKFLVTSGLIVAVSELAKRLTWVAAILASLPLVSVLSFLWLEKAMGLRDSLASKSR